ncbi:klarsicht protein isoform X2 [Prorops nasuta]|uniref:klarsicht protein isoform X2 n=1 Tax=Prorops nasuta TaxID=863751 RepID=UPI0034CD51DD
MKMSFSLSSLQLSSRSLERQRKGGIQAERPYNSLTKKRKDTKQIYSQRAFSNKDDCKDDFWAAIRSNYDYIMDTNLIDCCKEANCELIWDETDVSTHSWSLKEVSCQFSELYSWLRILQELIYSKEENLLDKSLRAAHMEELKRKAYRRKLFNEQAGKLVSRVPALKDEVAWRVDHLNAKWELVEQIMAPVERPVSSEQGVTADFEHEVKCLRKWLREMESRLQPLSFHLDWSRVELEEKAVEHMILQRDIEAHGRIVSSVVKLSERVVQQREKERDRKELDGKHEKYQGSPLKIASLLERRWHLLFLRSLEWQCHLETLVSRVAKNAASRAGSNNNSSSESDEEPVTKQPRLNLRGSRDRLCPDPGRTVSRRPRRELKRRVSFSDSDASSSENRFVDDGFYFEDELCQLCAMDVDCESSLGIPTNLGCTVGEGDQEAKARSLGVLQVDVEMPPTPDTTQPIDQIDGIHETNVPKEDLVNTNENPKRRRIAEEAASFNTSDRKSRNCATFYFKHLDTDSEADRCAAAESSSVQEDSSEDEWTYTASSGYVTSSQKRKNVVVRLDFGETTSFQRTENIRFVRNNNEQPEIPGSPDKVDKVERGIVPDLNEGQRISVEAKIGDNERETGNINGEGTKMVGEVEEVDQRGAGKELQENVGDKKDSDDESRDSKTSIQRLIKEVEKLVREENPVSVSSSLPQLILEDKGITNNHRAKYARIKEWLRLNSALNYQAKFTSHYWLQPLDSCDASGEYTTEDSDLERQSETSEEPLSSVATYRRCNTSFTSNSTSRENFEDPDKTLINELDSSTPKVVMRSKQKSNQRPWSVSCISQIGANSSMSQVNDTISQFSISETALHQLVTGPPTKSSLDVSHSKNSFNSTSTLLEESVGGCDGRVARNSLLRKKKSRLRRRNLGRKSESSSEGVQMNNSGGSDASNNPSSPRKTNARRLSKEKSTLVKSGSFSGCSAPQQMSVERMIVSDPAPPFWLHNNVNVKKTSAISSSETDEEERVCVKGHKYGDSLLLDNVFNSKELCNRQFNVDSDVEMNSLGNNSFSEQAWDNYQEKYMSETYSEAADVETARRLLEFGDDYRNFLDSQSDCASSMGVIPASSPQMPKNKKRHEVIDTTEDSDSDVDNLRNVLDKSQAQLAFSENRFLRSNGTAPEEHHAEIECTCRENLRLLNAFLEPTGISVRSEKYARQIRGMVERWESLSARMQETQKATALHRELAAFHKELSTIREKFLSYEVTLDQPQLLGDQINSITAELAALRERKTAMLSLNVSTHRLITDLGASATLIFTALKDGVADLYRTWDEIFQKGNQQLCSLQAVQQFSSRLVDLQCVLKRDKDTLAVLDVALQAGATTEVASSVRHVARLLSEKQDVNSQDVVALSDQVEKEVTPKFADGILVTQEGGSLSDSGISDSGSEQELSERERRLAALRRLTRTLEGQLPPGCKALKELWTRVEDAEAELRELQRQCRDLIVRTAASVDTKIAAKSLTNDFIAVKPKCSPIRESRKSSPKIIKRTVTHDGDPESEPGSSGNWVWRILRAALPFQLALIALFCAACLLEPHCCEATNSLNLSLTPQLRYIKGPPPV